MQHQQQQQQQQQQEVVGGGPQSLGGGYGGGAAAAEMVISDEDQKLGDLGIAEAASPISSRPPAPAANFEEMIQATAEAGGSSGGNRWPRQETLALLQIRSEMDAAFRDATLKGPLWEQVSRKLAELGYKRSAKKCKEKFENVHKYYKRTKEGRGGRQDGKSYKFFTQLEALNHNTSTSVQILPRISAAAAAAASVSLPPPIPPPAPAASFPPPPDHIATAAATTGMAVTHNAPAVSLFDNIGVSFSSDNSSSEEEEDDEDDEEMETESADNRNQRKRKRGSHDGDERMMDFFEGLLKQVMQKQESMQQKFLEAIEKREQDRMIREEAWKRQEMVRIAREHDLMAQERAISASRDAAIIAFLEKITGQTIHLPTAAPPNPPPPVPAAAAPPSQPQEHAQQRQSVVPSSHPQQPPSIEITESHDHLVAAIPEQQIPVQDLSGVEMSSSRWPKAEVLALIELRSGMELRYQEAGPKGPLWEEISSGMRRMGYNRSAKRCKEKWENINKYFKKVKESNKKRPEDSKTCPYFHELDALYRKKIVGSTSGSVGGLSEAERKLQQDVGMQSLQSLPGNVSLDKDGGEKQPEDMLKKHHQHSHGDMIDNSCNSVDCSNSDDIDEDNYEEVDENEEYDDKTEEEMKMVYEIQFQRQNVGSSNGGGTTSSSFVAMVQ